MSDEARDRAALGPPGGSLRDAASGPQQVTVPLRVTHLSASDSGGGAAIAAYRIHRGLSSLGVNSRMLVREKRSNDPGVVAFQPEQGIPRTALRGLQRFWQRAGLSRHGAALGRRGDPFTLPRTPGEKNVVKQLPASEIAHLHWTAGFLGVGALRPLFQRAQVFWTLHDMNLLTGGCHYSLGCERFRTGCGCCPMLDSRRVRDLSRRGWRAKQRAFARIDANRATVVCPSEWLAGLARSVPFLAGIPVEVVPYGIDTAAFVPVEQRLARSALGLPAEAPILACVAEDGSNPRKGWHYLQQAVGSLSDVDQLCTISVGRTAAALQGRTRHYHLGYAESPALLSLVYSAADFLVVPSIEDNFPNTVIEALSCSTPVIAFRTGGLPEMIEDGATGRLVPVGDSAELAGAIRQTLSSQRLPEMRAAARHAAETRFSAVIQARRYVALYQSAHERG